MLIFEPCLFQVVTVLGSAYFRAMLIFKSALIIEKIRYLYLENLKYDDGHCNPFLGHRAPGLGVNCGNVIRNFRETLVEQLFLIFCSFICLAEQSWDHSRKYILYSSTID